ncbi:MAG: glutaredoxin family protein [Burkholderiaceae bacterium]|nr:glutaredoxin family protein [Burkholderiaceae bacterium]
MTLLTGTTQPRSCKRSACRAEGSALQSSLTRFVARTAWWVLLCLSLAAASPLQAQRGPDVGTNAHGPLQTIEVFVREGCPHCTDTKAFLAQLQRERPGLDVRLHAVDTDATARDRLIALSRAAGAWPPGVPTFVVGDRVLIGFDDAQHMGLELRALLDAANASPATALDSALFGRFSASQMGLPLFTLVLGLLEGFNPCAMWVLLFLLSLLVRLRDRRRMALIAGTFVLTSGAVYYAFMAAWLNVFLAVGFSGPLCVGLALAALMIGAFNVKDFFAPGQGPSLAIPGSAKPALVARMARLRDSQALPTMLLSVTALAIAVNFVELLCTAGLPAVYTAVLAQQGLSPAAHYGYLGLYILGYIADDSLMVGIAIIALGSGKLGERGGRLLKLLSGFVMLALGAVLLWRPQWLM